MVRKFLLNEGVKSLLSKKNMPPAHEKTHHRRFLDLDSTDSFSLKISRGGGGPRSYSGGVSLLIHLPDTSFFFWFICCF